MFSTRNPAPFVGVPSAYTRSTRSGGIVVKPDGGVIGAINSSHAPAVICAAGTATPVVEMPQSTRCKCARAAFPA